MSRLAPVDDPDTLGPDDDRGVGGRGLAFGLLTALVVSLVLGFVVFGSGDAEPPGVTDTASGCRVHALKYTVTDDPEVFAEQKRFEQTSNVLPKPAFYREEVDLVAARHAASHEWVVVFYGDGELGADGQRGLEALEQRAVSTKAPVIVAPHDEGDDAIVALARGYQLACREGGAAQAAEVSRFAAQLYPSVADPKDPITTGPAPTTATAAPSPAAQAQ